MPRGEKIGRDSWSVEGPAAGFFACDSDGRNYSMLRSILKPVAGALALALLVAGPAGSASLEQPSNADTPGSAPAVPPGLAVAQVRGDVDGDGIEDILFQRMESAQEGETFDVIVMFDGPGAVGRAHAAAGPFAVTREFSIINGFQASLTGPQIRGLANAPGLFSISANGTVQANDIPSNDDMGATDAVLDFGFDGTGVTICVVDTGVDAAHELFATKGLGPGSFHDAVNGLANPYDDNGHGSHVSGISTGNGGLAAVFPASDAIGAAPGASLVVTKVLDANGQGTDAQVIDGIEWCAARADVDILNMSLGGPSTDGTDPLSVAVNCVADPSSSPSCSGSNAAKIMVVSAGNAGAFSSTIGTPGVAANAITVGSVAEWSGDPATNWQDDGLYLNTFSSRGPVVDGAGNFVRMKPDLTGPGSRVLSAYVFNQTPDNSYGIASGTSMSAPFVSGVIALMLQADPSLGVEDAGGLPHVKVRNILAATAHDRGAAGMDNEYGHGVVDAYSAVAQASGATSYVPNAYPGYTRITAQSVADFGTWIHNFTVTPELVGLPIAGSAIIDGSIEFGCILWQENFDPEQPGFCLFSGNRWEPDLEIILEEETSPGVWSQVTPGSGEVTFSECPARGECGQVGRAEVVHFIPQNTGEFRFVVFPAEDANQGMGGGFDFEISMGAPVFANAPPTAVYTFTTSDLTANFTDGSSDSDGTIVSRSWDFGDASPLSSDTNPSHLYAAAGTYSVILTVTDDMGDSSSDTQLVTVAVGNVPPTAAYTFTTNDLTANFTDASSDSDGTIVSRSWDFGDSSPASSDSNPSHLYGAAGTYTVVLTVTDDDGDSSTDTQSVTVVENVAPTAGFTFTTSDLTANFTDASSDSDGTIVSRSWDFGDGNNSTAASPSHTYATANTYTVILTVTDDDGAISTDTQSVTVTDPPPNEAPVASFNVSENPCPFNALFGGWVCQFNNTSTDADGPIPTQSWNWDYGDGTNETTVWSPTALYVVEGTYTVVLTVTDDKGDSDSASVVVQIGSSTVNAHIGDLDDVSVSTGGRWDAKVEVLVLDDGGAPLANAFVEGGWSNGANGNGSCTTDASGLCSITKSRLKNNVSGVTFTLNNISGSGIDGYDPAANTDPDGGSYGANEHVIDVAKPVANQSPTAAFTVDVCPAGTCGFTDTSSDSDGSIVSWDWDFGDGGSSAQQNPSHTFADGSYTVTLTVTDDGGATNSTSQVVTVSTSGNQAPIASFTYLGCDSNLCTFTDTSTDPDAGGSVVSWNWDFGDGGSSTSSGPVTRIYDFGGDYTVTLTVTDNDGASDSTSQVVTVVGPAPPLALDSAEGFKDKGVQKVNLTWSGGPDGGNVWIHRTGTSATVVETLNDGFELHNIGAKGGGSYSFQICETAVVDASCSNSLPVVF
jgi:serine protease AprX